MAHDLGAEYMELVARAYHPGRSGDIQLLAAPFNSANYPQESLSLVPRDPRTSHASVWMYLERVPLVVYGASVTPADSEERVSLADVAPTIAELVGFDDFLDLGREGRPLPGIDRPAAAPEVVVTFVIDGGGWNVLREYPDAWPNLRRLMDGGANFRNALHGSFPAVTASAHATLGRVRSRARTGSPDTTCATDGEPGKPTASSATRTPATSSFRPSRTSGAMRRATGHGSESSGTRSGTSG